MKRGKRWLAVTLAFSLVAFNLVYQMGTYLSASEMEAATQSLSGKTVEAPAAGTAGDDEPAAVEETKGSKDIRVEEVRTEEPRQQSKEAKAELAESEKKAEAAKTEKAEATTEVGKSEKKSEAAKEEKADAEITEETGLPKVLTTTMDSRAITKSLYASNSYVKLHPANFSPTSVKVKTGQRINGYKITRINGYDITVDLGRYNVNNSSFVLPYASTLWNGVPSVNYISWAGGGGNQKSEGASALLANGGNTAYYYFDDITYRTFSLQYSANGGTGAPAGQSYTATSRYEYSHTFHISGTIPNREGYDFKGWSTSPTATKATYQPYGSIYVSDTTTLYAVWEQKSTEYQYVLTYNANGGTGAPGQQKSGFTTETNYTFRVSGAQPTRDGYIFMGWADDRNATTTQYTKGSEIKLTSTNPTKRIFAVWKQKTAEQPLTVEKHVTSHPVSGNRGYYEMGDTVQWEITIKNPNSVPKSVGVGESLNYNADSGNSTVPFSKFGWEGTNKTVLVPAKGTVDIGISYTTNLADVNGGSLANASMLFNHVTISYQINDTYQHNGVDSEVLYLKEPVSPSEPNDPVSPAEPTNPAGPIDPEEPANPEGPANPTNPTDVAHVATLPGVNNPVNAIAQMLNSAEAGGLPFINSLPEIVPAAALAAVPAPAADVAGDAGDKAAARVKELTQSGDGEVPLANKELNHDCCILHFLLALLAIVVFGFYTRDRKKGQRKIFELREELDMELARRGLPTTRERDRAKEWKMGRETLGIPDKKIRVKA